MNKGSSLFLLLGIFLATGVYSFWKQKLPKSVIALLAIGSTMSVVAALLQL